MVVSFVALQVAILSRLTITHSVIHRADYHGVLLDETLRLGGELRLDAEVVEIDYEAERPQVVLHTGEVISGDVIVGADGKPLPKCKTKST